MFALIGPTASGKTGLGIELGKELGYSVVSLDSMAVYKEVDILSAKPTPEEREGVPHYGIDLVYPDQSFSVVQFFKVVEEAVKREGERLIIVGGTGFYLKSLIEGISPMPPISAEVKREAERRSYRELAEIDPAYCSKISPTDRYRIRRGWEIYLTTGLPPSRYFEENPPRSPFPHHFPIFEIAVERGELRKKIWKRTEEMFKKGLVDEVAYLEWKYRDRTLPALKSIGAREVLDYFNGRWGLEECRERVAIHTAQLAKRQQIFNRTQFPNRISRPLLELKREILRRAEKGEI
jgi:tRNA dimethylallyltransferase